MRKIETEITLVITSRETAHRLGRIRNVGEYRLTSFRTISLWDRYFDTPGGDFGLEGNALRLRQYEGKTWITFKGRSHRARGHAMDRFEIEERWSRRALAEVSAALGAHGSLLPDPGGASPPSKVDPVAALRGLGLHVIQDRSVLRKARDVRCRNRRTLLAELVVDEVEYRFGGALCRLYEVEVELSRGDAPSILNEITNRLLDRFPEELAAWPHSKLETGMILEQLAVEGRLESLLAQDGSLFPSAYAIIDAAAVSLDKKRDPLR